MTGFHFWEFEELAARVVGIDPDSEDYDSGKVDDAILDRFGVDLDGFSKIAEALIPFTVTAATAISGTKCQGFVHDGAFVVKKELPA